MSKWPRRQAALPSDSALGDDTRARAHSRRAAVTESCRTFPAASQEEEPPASAEEPGDSHASRPAVPRGEASSSSSLLGPVAETQEQHLARHAGGRADCPRCRYYTQGRAWARVHGMVVESRRAGPCAARTWLAERPVRFGGAWGLGCVMCAAALCRDAACGRRRARRRTRWARYEVRAASLQSEHIRQHKEYDAHRLAIQAWLRPDLPVQLALQASLGDDELLARGVPQPEDWLRTWRACRTPQSWSVAAQHLQTEHHIRPTRDRSIKARPLVRMARIIREVVRTKKREMIRKAEAMTLSFDDRKGYKLVRFRVDTLRSTPAASLEVPATWKTVAFEGIVGCLQCLRGSTLEDLADDYAVNAAKEVMTMLERLCTPLSEPKDDGLLDHVRLIVVGVVADGALQKVSQVLKQTCFLRIVLIVRDPAHFLRIACKDPLTRTGRFEAQYERLFTGTGALFKKIAFSDSMKARLEACQHLVLQSQGEQGGGVTNILRHLNFVQPRFESWVEPRRRYACMLLAVILLLAEIAGDKRKNPADRKMAERCLDAMTPEELLEAGISGDWGEVCMRFLREFDQEDRDASTTADKLQDWIQTCRRLFVDGWIMVDPAKHPSVSTGDAGEATIPEKTITQIICEQLKEAIHVRYGNTSKRIYGPSSKAECAVALADMGGIAEDAIARAEADFAGLYMDFIAMNVSAWRKSRDNPEKHARLRTAARRLCTALGVPYSSDQWNRVYRFIRRVQDRAGHQDNRVLWAAALAASQGTDMEADVAALRPLIAFFVAWTDGTGSVERFLGAHASFLEAHVGGDDVVNDAAETCLEIAREGPSTEAEMFEKVDGVLRFTEFSRSCARLWRTLHGRRFACYKERKDKGAVLKWRMKGSLKSVGVGQARAVKALVALAEKHEPGRIANKKADDVDTFIGVGRKSLMRTVAKTSRSAPSKLLRRFRATTGKRVKTKAKAGVWQGFDQTPINLLPKPGEGGLSGMVALPHDPPAFSHKNNVDPRSQLRAVGSKWLRRVTTPAVAQGGQGKDPVLVSSLYELHTSKLDRTKLLPWLNVVALGQSVQATDAGADRECYLPAIETPAKIFLHVDFRRKYGSLTTGLRLLARSTNSKWQLAELEGETGATTFQDAEDCRRFLLRIRRLPTKAGVHASFLKRPLSQPGAGLAASQGGPMKAGVQASFPKRPLSQPGASPAASQGGPAARRGNWPRRCGP